MASRGVSFSASAISANSNEICRDKTRSGRAPARSELLQHGMAATCPSRAKGAEKFARESARKREAKRLCQGHKQRRSTWTAHHMAEMLPAIDTSREFAKACKAVATANQLDERKLVNSGRLPAMVGRLTEAAVMSADL